MSGVLTATAVGGLVAGGTGALVGATIGTGIYSANQGKKAADRAAAASQAATDATIAENKRQFDLTRSDTAYQRRAGEAATGALMDVLNLNPYVTRSSLDSGIDNPFSKGFTSFSQKPIAVASASSPTGMRSLMRPPQTQTASRWKASAVGYGSDVTMPTETTGPKPYEQTPGYEDRFRIGQFDYKEDPGYAFRLKQGEKALSRVASKRGYGESRTSQALSQFNQDLASQEYGAAYDRFIQQQQLADLRKQQELENLFRVAGYGGQAVQTSAQAGQASARNTSGALMSNAANLGSAAQYGAESTNNAVQGTVQNLLTFRNYNNLLNRLPSSGGVSNIIANQYPDVAYT